MGKIESTKKYQRVIKNFTELSLQNLFLIYKRLRYCKLHNL